MTHRIALLCCGAALLAAASPSPLSARDMAECVLAQVNGEIITLTDFQSHKKATLDELYRLKLSDEEMQKRLADARDNLLPDLIEEKLLMQKARDLGLSVGKEDVDRVVKSIMEQNKIADDATLETELKKEGLTVAQLRANIERRTLIEKLKQYEIASRVVVTDEEAKRYYDGHREEFREPERVRLREIVLLIEKRGEEQVRKEIDELAKMVRNGADFAELATLFSQAPTAEHGGDLGLIKTSDLAPEIAQAADKLQPGEVSPPVQTKFGFHVLKLIERKPVSYRTLEQARDDIGRKVSEGRYGDKLKEYLVALKRDAYIQINEECKTVAK